MNLLRDHPSLRFDEKFISEIVKFSSPSFLFSIDYIPLALLKDMMSLLILEREKVKLGGISMKNPSYFLTFTI